MNVIKTILRRLCEEGLILVVVSTLLFTSEVQPNKIGQPHKSSSLELSSCEQATNRANKIHWLYIEGAVDIHVDYNEYKKAKQICGGL